MTSQPPEQFPPKKSPEYMRKAYLYTGILFVVCLIGAVILANRITTAEAARDALLQEAEQAEQAEDPPAGDEAP